MHEDLVHLVPPVSGGLGDDMNCQELERVLMHQHPSSDVYQTEHLTT